MRIPRRRFLIAIVGFIITALLIFALGAIFHADSSELTELETKEEQSDDGYYYWIRRPLEGNNTGD